MKGVVWVAVVWLVAVGCNGSASSPDAGRLDAGSTGGTTGMGAGTGGRGDSGTGGSGQSGGSDGMGTGGSGVAGSGPGEGGNAGAAGASGDGGADGIGGTAGSLGMGGGGGQFGTGGRPGTGGTTATGGNGGIGGTFGVGGSAGPGGGNGAGGAGTVPAAEGTVLAADTSGTFVIQTAVGPAFFSSIGCFGVSVGDRVTFETSASLCVTNRIRPVDDQTWCSVTCDGSGYEGTVTSASGDSAFVISTLFGSSQFDAQTFCFNIRPGDNVLFSRSPAACASNSFADLRTGNICKVWCR